MAAKATIKIALKIIHHKSVYEALKTETGMTWKLEAHQLGKIDNWKSGYKRTHPRMGTQYYGEGRPRPKSLIVFPL